MSGEVIFEEDRSYGSQDLVSTISIVPGTPSGLLKWLIDNKIAKNGVHAEKILLWFTVTIVVFAIGLQIFIHPFGTTKTLSGIKLEAAQELQAQMQQAEQKLPELRHE